MTRSLLATGADVSRSLGIPGEDLPGSHHAGDFVAWYNGHPDYRDCYFDLDCEAATVIGHGNVALDVARILAKTADELRRTDIASACARGSGGKPHSRNSRGRTRQAVASEVQRQGAARFPRS